MDLGVPELLIIAFIVILLFGSKKLPGAAKSIGQSLKIFKDETKGLHHQDDAAAPAATPAAPVTPAVIAAPVQPVPAAHVAPTPVAVPAEASTADHADTATRS